MVSVEFPFRTGPTWEIQPKPSLSDRSPVPSTGTCIRWDDDDDYDNCIVLSHGRITRRNDKNTTSHPINIKLPNTVYIPSLA